MLTESTKSFISTVRNTTNIGAALFRQPLENLSFTALAQVSAGLQVIKKVIKDRRSQARDLLIDRIKDGDVDGFEVTETPSGKSLKVGIDNFTVRLTFAGGNRKIDDDAVEELFDEKGLEKKQVFDDVEASLDEKAVVDFLEDNGVDVEQFLEHDYSDADESVLEALAATGAVDEEDVEKCFYKTSVSERLTCTFDDDVKGYLKEAIEEGTGDIDRLEGDDE